MSGFKRPPGAAKVISAAIMTTYSQALQIDVAAKVGPAWKLLKESAAKAAAQAPPRTATGKFGEDPKTTFDVWIGKPTNAELSLKDLNAKFISIISLVAGPRSVDIFNLPPGSSVSSPSGLEGRQLKEADRLQIAYFNSKTSGGRESRARHGWSSQLTISALRPEVLQKTLGFDKKYALRVADRCSLIRVIGELEHRLVVALRSRGQPVSIRLGKRFAISDRLLMYSDTDINGKSPIQYLKTSTISSTLKKFHNAHFASTCGAGKDLEARHYRHISAGLMEAMGRSSCREERLTQANAKQLWEAFYNILPAAPSFCSRWQKLSEESRALLNTDECFLA